MNLSTVELHKIKTFFANKPVKKIYLFGSYAHSDANENSDFVSVKWVSPLIENM